MRSMATEAAVLILLEQRMPEWVSVEDICSFMALDVETVQVVLHVLNCEGRCGVRESETLNIVAARHFELEADPCA